MLTNEEKEHVKAMMCPINFLGWFSFAFNLIWSLLLFFIGAFSLFHWVAVVFLLAPLMFSAFVYRFGFRQGYRIRENEES